MSREIKFRAWDKDEQEYCYDAEHTYDYLCSSRGCMAESFGDVLDQPGRYIVEQYTGLKDKNGKQIYEGDIVRTTDKVTVKGLIFPVGVVEFKQQAFWICNVPSERPDFTHNEALLQYWETDLEVIGNIHEPPKDFRPEHLKRMGVTIVKGGEDGPA